MTTKAWILKRNALRAAFTAIFLLGLATAWVAAAEPLGPQLFHTLEHSGGLIEGTALGIEDGDLVVVRINDETTIDVPLELFEQSDKEALCEHFELETPAEPEPGDPPAQDALHPWHSLRGGIMLYGQIVSLHDDVATIADAKGNRYRVPLPLLASGALQHAEAAIAKLDPEKITKSKGEPRKSKTVKKPMAKPMPKGPRPDSPAPPKTVAPTPTAPPMPPENPIPPGDNPPAEDGEEIGNLRRWKNGKGEVVATGKFRRRGAPENVTIVDEKGESISIEFRSLSNDDQIYIQVVEAGGRIEIAAAASAIPREISAEAMREWKTVGGLTMARGEFVELKNGMVSIFEADQRTKQLPLDLLSVSDRQYAEAMASGKGPGKAPEGVIVIAGESPELIPSLQADRLLLLDGSSLKVISADGKTELASHALPEGASRVAERAEYYVVAAGKTLYLLDKETLEPVGEHELWKIQKINEIALHPKNKWTFVSVENALDEVRDNEDERQRLAIIDENTGKITMLPDAYGKWVLVDPTGTLLLTGYKDVTKSFGDLHINPDGNIIENHKWDNTDILRRYKIRGQKIELDEEFPNAGANGQGLVLAPNGKQVSYLSFTGYPTFSGNIALLDTRNFNKKPVTLRTKDVADCKQLAFHPSLPIAAAVGRDAVVLFDTRSGKEASTQPEIPTELKGAAVHELAFSGDGQYLVIIASVGGGDRYVVSLPVATSAINAKPSSEPTAEAESARREWKDKTGKFKVEAEFVKLKEEVVVLRKVDGTEIEVPLTRLSPKDQLLARKLGREE